MPVQDFLSLKQAILAAMSQGQLGECQKLAVGYVQKVTSEVLNFMPLHCPEPMRSLIDLGFDSMKAMELRYRIETELEVNIPREVFIGTVTLAQVAGLLLDQLVLSSVIQSEPLSSRLNDDSEEITL